MEARMKHSLTSRGTVALAKSSAADVQELECRGVLQTHLENLIGATWPKRTPSGRCLKALRKLARIQDQRVLRDEIQHFLRDGALNLLTTP